MAEVIGRGLGRGDRARQHGPLLLKAQGQRCYVQPHGGAAAAMLPSDAQSVRRHVTGEAT
eukprot:5407599-Prymnesium_polylepis.1